MDELQISGKRFISSRRIAKDNGYHSDYIGQLIRGKKIKGQKVGRTWYVDAESFDAYLGGEGVIAPAELPEEKVLGSASPQPDHFLQKVLPPQVSAPVDEPSPIVEVAPVVIEKKEEVVAEIKKEEQEQEQEIEIKKIVEPAAIPAHYVPVSSGGLRFVSDEEPLLPEISAEEPIMHVMPQAGAVMHERRPRAARIIFALAGTAVVIFIFSAVVSSTLFQTINIQADNSASVGYGFGW